MAEFYATTPSGLAPALLVELQELGFKKLRPTQYGIYFEGSWKECYRANLQSRIASRIFKPLLDFTAYDLTELKGHIQKHDFTKYISPKQTLAVSSSVQQCKIYDQRIVALAVKDVIVDQFRFKFGERPSVEKENPDLPIVVYGHKNHFWIHLDTSGAPLHQRGYRATATAAPIKENLAAGLLRLADWNPTIPLVDPFCGSGTFLIEAALMAQNIYPGLLRKKPFAFQKWKNYSADVFDRLVEDLTHEEKELDLFLWGMDIDPKVLSVARENARRAGVLNSIQWQRISATNIRPPTQKPGYIVTNPPYGDRLSSLPQAQELLRDLSATLKNHFPNWTVWLLSGHPELTKSLKLKAEKKYVIYNGSIECRFLKYCIKKGTYDTRAFRKF